MNRQPFPPHPAPPPPEPPPLGDGVNVHPDRSTLLSLLSFMLLSRKIEERTVALYRQGMITGGCYTGIGNEATSVGFALPLDREDVVLPTHRDMGTHLVRGHLPVDVMRQYMKRRGCQTGGKDSSLHMGVEGSNIIGHISPLAHNMPVAAGVAYAERVRKRSAVVLTSVGDGATSLGDFHEALNFAAIQKLGILFVIVNNQYAYSTPNTIQYACERLSERAAGYGMAGEQVDGTDVIAVYDLARRAIARARRGEGPTLIESVTMRMRGHSEHDDMKYVPKELVDRWRAWDPISRLVLHVRTKGVISEEELSALERRIDAEIDLAVEIAAAEPPPDPTSAKEGVYRVWEPRWTPPPSGEGLP